MAIYGILGFLSTFLVFLPMISLGNLYIFAVTVRFLAAGFRQWANSLKRELSGNKAVRRDFDSYLDSVDSLCSLAKRGNWATEYLTYFLVLHNFLFSLACSFCGVAIVFKVHDLNMGIFVYSTAFLAMVMRSPDTFYRKF